MTWCNGSAVGYLCWTTSAITFVAALSLLANLYLGETGKDLQHNYGVVMDAGSVHTTTSVYAWPAVRTNITGQVREVFSCEGSADSGVSSYADKPERVGEGLEAGGCLRQALGKVPTRLRPNSVLFMGATAGMRVLNATNSTSAGRIINYADEFLQRQGFRPGRTAEIMQSAEEGVMGWITVNYLNGTFDGKQQQRSVGALDWGGASSQITFEEAKSGGHRKVTLFEREYSVFTASHLCYGQKEALRRYFVEQIYRQWTKSEDKSQLPVEVESPCLPRRDSDEDADSSSLYTLPASELFFSVCTRRSDVAFQRLAESGPNLIFRFVGTSNLTSCDAEVAKAFDLAHCRQSYRAQHCFDSADIPRPDSKTTFLAFSTYWYLVSALHITPGVIGESDFEAVINKLCKSSLGYALGLLGGQGVEVEHTSCFKVRLTALLAYNA